MLKRSERISNVMGSVQRLYQYSVDSKTVGSGEAILLEFNEVQDGGIYPHGATTGRFTLLQGGQYIATYAVNAAEPSKWGLFLDNGDGCDAYLVQGSEKKSGCDCRVFLTTRFFAPAGSSLALVNLSNCPVFIPSANTDTHLTNAFISIQKIQECCNS
jgi:hypothetical protein